MLAILTVGSTEFTELACAFLDISTLDALRAKGITSILAQVGNSTLPADSRVGKLVRQGLDIEIVNFLPDIESRISSAAIVVSHAGAGSILSVMRPSVQEKAGKIQLIVVPNTTLMDSHQQDLANELKSNDWARVASPETLASIIMELNLYSHSSIVSYPAFNRTLLSDILDAQCGFT